MGKKRKRRMPTRQQWEKLRGVLANGWGDGDYAEAVDATERVRNIQSIRAFEAWLEDQYMVSYAHHIA